MDLLKTVRKRSFLSEVVYVVLNLSLAVALLVAVLVVNVPWLALGVVLLSKWRIFAVRPRYWIANIRANLIDIIVGVSMVIFLYASSGQLTVQIILVALYAIWLLYIKPRSKRAFVATQAFVGLVWGISAIVQVSPGLSSSLVVLLSWVVGYSAARHILSVQHESHINFLSLLWGFVVAEIMWLTYHWTIGYFGNGDLGTRGVIGFVGNVFELGALQISQSAIIIGVLSFVAERTYSSFHRNGHVQSGDIVLPVLLSLSVIAVLLFVFNRGVAI